MPATNAARSTQLAMATGILFSGNASSSTATTTMFTKAIGMRPFQQKLMSWSIRIRGSVARIHMKIRTKA